MVCHGLRRFPPGIWDIFSLSLCRRRRHRSPVRKPFHSKIYIVRCFPSLGVARGFRSDRIKASALYRVVRKTRVKYYVCLPVK